MTDKYTPLHDLLAAAAQRGDAAVQLRLDDIAKLVGGLPASAHNHRAWWANGSHAHAAAWLDAGWNVAVVSQPDGFVRFERNRAEPGGTTPASSRRAGGGSEPTRGARNAVIDAATLPLLEKTVVRVTLEWRDAGPIGLDSGGGLVFPRLPSVPGLYRMTLSRAAGQTRSRIYIGETDDLRRRVANYRTPGPTQDTNLRLNAKMKAQFAHGGVAVLAIGTSVALELGAASGNSKALDLARKAARLLAENAALVTAQLTGEADIENLE